VGWVDEVHGKGAIEEAGFVPTRHELLQLLQYWYERISETSFFQFYYSQVGSAENNVVDFAKRRISRIEQVLGHDVVRGQLRRLAFGIIAGTTAGIVANVAVIFLSVSGLKQWRSMSNDEYRELLSDAATKALRYLSSVPMRSLFLEVNHQNKR
jgi:hypothetical protein